MNLCRSWNPLIRVITCEKVALCCRCQEKQTRWILSETKWDSGAQIETCIFCADVCVIRGRVSLVLPLPSDPSLDPLWEHFLLLAWKGLTDRFCFLSDSAHELWLKQTHFRYFVIRKSTISIPGSIVHIFYRGISFSSFRLENLNKAYVLMRSKVQITVLVWRICQSAYQFSVSIRKFDVRRHWTQLAY